MGVPRPAYGDGEYASPSLEASQDWHRMMELMPNDEDSPKGVNLDLGEE
jgi:hypothetical protein